MKRKITGLLTGSPRPDGTFALCLECGHIAVGKNKGEYFDCLKCDEDATMGRAVLRAGFSPLVEGGREPFNSALAGNPQPYPSSRS